MSRVFRTPLLVVWVSCLSAACSEPPSSSPREATWKKVGTWSGRGNQQLETFPVERLSWRVRWETRSRSPAELGRFHVTVNSGDSGRVIAESAEVQGASEGLFYVSEVPHRYYFVVASAGVDWTLTAEEPVVR